MNLPKTKTYKYFFRYCKQLTRRMTIRIKPNYAQPIEEYRTNWLIAKNMNRVIKVSRQ